MTGPSPVSTCGAADRSRRAPASLCPRSAAGRRSAARAARRRPPAGRARPPPRRPGRGAAGPPARCSSRRSRRPHPWRRRGAARCRCRGRSAGRPRWPPRAGRAGAARAWRPAGSRSAAGCRRRGYAFRLRTRWWTVSVAASSRRAADVVDALGRGDMLQHDAQLGQPAAQRLEHAVDEHRLAVEDVDLRVRHLAVDAERQADLGHALQHGHDAIEVAHARARSWSWPPPDRASPPGRARSRPRPRRPRVGGFGQVERHQRRKAGPSGSAARMRSR